jgi:poly-gamma-glutamate synthesis protein (capsule biosynthesis protein)
MRSRFVTVFLCGDVMTGRGVDQILRHPSAPRLHEPAVDDARAYVELAEELNGPIPRKAAGSYVWGDALEELERAKPDARIVNLETSITRSDDFWPDKGIHYRMHPENVACLTAGGIDVCVLANNHVLDCGRAGLLETLETLARSGIKTTGAGTNLEEARQPAFVELAGGGRLVAFALASATSGVSPAWAATKERPGVELLDDLSPATAADIAARVGAARRPGDLVIASIHWGSNWGYEVSPELVRFAHWLVDAGVDLVHGHSSHHVRPIEVDRNHLILYGCGDFIDDYEGIAGYEEFRDDLVLMYFATLDAASGELIRLRMVPMQLRKLRLTRPSGADVRWLEETVARTSAEFGSSVELAEDGSLLLHWRGEAQRSDHAVRDHQAS